MIESKRKIFLYTRRFALRYRTKFSIILFLIVNYIYEILNKSILFTDIEKKSWEIYWCKTDGKSTNDFNGHHDVNEW